MSYKGRFRPINPSKYKGDPSNIIYRSLWELRCMSFFDMHKDVLQWSSEEVVVPYVDPSTGRRRRYFPDFWIKRKERDGKISECMIEVKPKKQTIPPKVQQKPTKRYIKEVYTWGINSSKWEAAKKYCTAKGWDFIIMTEDDIPTYSNK